MTRLLSSLLFPSINILSSFTATTTLGLYSLSILIPRVINLELAPFSATSDTPLSGDTQVTNDKELNPGQEGAHLPGNHSGSSSIHGEKLAPVHQESVSPRNVHGLKWVLVVLSIPSSTFLFSLDNTVVADVQPKIIERFGEISKLPWLAVSFVLGSASTNLIW